MSPCVVWQSPRFFSRELPSCRDKFSSPSQSVSSLAEEWPPQQQRQGNDFAERGLVATLATTTPAGVFVSQSSENSDLETTVEHTRHWGAPDDVALQTVVSLPKPPTWPPPGLETRDAFVVVCCATDVESTHRELSAVATICHKVSFSSLPEINNQDEFKLHP